MRTFPLEINEIRKGPHVMPDTDIVKGFLLPFCGHILLCVII